jgi:ubiquinone/menaquinone biosynthesis C-methylase UbiE
MNLVDEQKVKENKFCPICKSNNIKTVYSTHDRHYGIEGIFNVSKCNSCLVRFINPMPTEDELTKLYPENTFYAYTDFTQSLEEKNNLKNKIKRSFFLEIRTKDPKFSKPGKILDIGCGSGEFLYKYKQSGWETTGVEVNSGAASLGNRVAELNIFAGSLIQANLNSNYFDYIRSNHSFEHITNPHEVLTEANKLLKPGGKFLIGVPNIDSFNAYVFREFWWYLGVPVHTFNYSVKSLSHLLEEHNFIIDSVKFNSDYSGILGSLQIFINRKNGKVSSDGLMIKNPILKVLAHYGSKILDLLMIGDAIEIVCTKK